MNLHNESYRYPHGGMPLFQYFWRKCQDSSGLARLLFKVLYRLDAERRGIEISENTDVGNGLYIGHVYGITVNPLTKMGVCCNIHKGVTIGQENRGKRQGAPVIGNMVWIGVNATLVGKIKVGNDVLIAPNTYVNCDIPDYSVVFGNPCQIHFCKNATKGYINNILDYDGEGIFVH